MHMIANIFRFLCVVTAVFMVGFWLNKYQKNEDNTVTEYKTFEEQFKTFNKTLKEEEVTLYPELTICVDNPFLDQKLGNITPGINREMYLQYLAGNIPVTNKTYKRVSYEEVTLNLYDYLQNVALTARDQNIGPINCFSVHDCPFFHFKNNYNGFGLGQKGFLKCFGFAINNKYTNDISYAFMSFNHTLLDILDQGKYVSLFLSYPSQLFRNIRYFEIWQNSEERKKANQIIISSYEVLRRRSKSGKRCISNKNPYDDFILRQEIEKVGCKAPYFLADDSFPICEKPKDLTFFADISKKLSDNSILPCQEITHLSYKNNKEFKKSIDFTLFITYPKNIKVITQSRAIDHHTLIGNIGGYIGLFLGIISNYYGR